MRQGARQGARIGTGSHPRRARGGSIDACGWRQGEALHLLRFHHVRQERGGGGLAGSEPPDCVKACRAAAALALSPTVADLSSLFWDVLCLL